LVTTLPLAQVDTIADKQSTEIGRSLSEATRFCEVGGIVMHMTCTPRNLATFSPPSNPEVGIIDAKMLLCSDRLDNSATAVPVAITPNWFNNTQPLSVVHQPEDAQQTYPTQIHHQEYWCIHQGTTQGQSLEISTNPRVQLTETSRRTRSQRLRLRLDDQQTLVMQFTSRCRNFDDKVLDMGVEFLLTGTIYYRYIFGR